MFGQRRELCEWALVAGRTNAHGANLSDEVAWVATFREALPILQRLCKAYGMFALVLRRFLLGIVLLGIVLGPVSIVTAASAMVVSGEMQMSDEDMSCCPEQQPVKTKDCGSACPLALICSSSAVVHEPTVVDLHVALAWRGLSNDFRQEGQLPSAIVEPPARPPKR